jgi:hypothetical protein
MSAPNKNLTMVTKMLQLQHKFHASDSRDNVDIGSDASSASITAKTPPALVAWKNWTETHLPQLWKESQHCPLEFCRRSHRLFHATKRSEFADWNWDFLGALFDGQDCNCVCGTLFVVSAAEYIGIFPQYVQPMFGPNHVWVRIQTMEDDQKWFLETTLQPDHSQWCVPQEAALRQSFYGCGTWHTQPNAYAILQEVLINQILSSVEQRRSAMLQKLYRVIDELVEEGEEPTLDLSYILVRKYSSQARKWCPKQQKFIESMLIFIEQSEWAPECYLKSVMFIAKWIIFCLSHEMDLSERRHLCENTFERVHDLYISIQGRSSFGQWSSKCANLREPWSRLQKYVTHLEKKISPRT